MPLTDQIDHERLAGICRRYHVAKLELFGSHARGEARPDSDIDLLVTFEDGYTPGWELGGLLIDLTDLFGRKVDLITRWTLEHEPSEHFRRSVTAHIEPLYAA